MFCGNWTCTTRPGDIGGQDIWFTIRATKNADWGTPVNLGVPVNTAMDEQAPTILTDGSMLYYSSYRFNNFKEELWQAQIIPIVEFNGNRNIDTDDLLAMIDNWGTDDSTCDIGPMPWGDGIVDIEDLKIFMEYWEKENMPENKEAVG